MRAATMLCLLALAPLLEGGACGGPVLPEPESQCVSGAAPAGEALALGHVDETGAFSPFTDGAELTRERGGQGGSHVTVALQLYANDGAVWEHQLELVATPTVTVPFARSVVRAPSCAPGWSTTTDVRVVFETFEPRAEGFLKVRSGPSDLAPRLQSGPLRVKIRSP